jgi:predicted nuclease of predicted toxin-antitoxin system
VVAFLVDESLPRAVTRALVAAGHDVVDVRDVGLRGASDDAIAARARATSSIVVSGDLDFSNALRFPPGTHPGIVVTRLPDAIAPADMAARPLRQSPQWELTSRARSRSLKRRAFASSVVVTPLGLERVPVATSVREDPLVTDGDPGSDQDARGHKRTRAVASLATALAEAVLAGDQERARVLAEKLQELAVRP